MGMGKCLSATFALLVCASAAMAAPPQVDGKYAFISQTFCEAQLTIVKDSKGFVKDVLNSKSGMISSAIGYITFTPSSATAGSAAITGSTIVEGGAVRIGNSGFAWKQAGNNVGVTPYSFTNTQFTFGDQTYKMIVADAVADGFFRTVYLMRRATDDKNPDCVETIWVSKQPGE
jgi:hypothetical protein